MKRIKLIIILLSFLMICTSCNKDIYDFENFDNTKNYNANGFYRSNCMVFYDYENDATFYIGDKDNYIYKKKDNKDELIFEHKVSNLQYYNNMLYFTMKDNASENYGLYYEANGRGFIYSYDYKNDILNCLVEENVQRFKIDKQGIIYTKDNHIKSDDGKRIETVTDYFILNKNNNIKAIEWNDIIMYNNYKLLSKENNIYSYNIYLQDIKTNEEEKIIDDIDAFGVFGSVFDDKYIFYDNNGILYSIDIPNHSYRAYDLYSYECIPEETITGNPSFGNINAFTMINDEIYFSFEYSKDIYKINQNGECELFFQLTNLYNNGIDELTNENDFYIQQGIFGNIAFLHRDNKNLYIYTHATLYGDIRLIKIPIIKE